MKGVSYWSPGGIAAVKAVLIYQGHSLGSVSFWGFDPVCSGNSIRHVPPDYILAGSFAGSFNPKYFPVFKGIVVTTQ